MEENTHTNEPSYPAASSEGGLPAPAPEMEQPRRGRPLLMLGLILAGAALLIFFSQRYASQQPLATGPSAPLEGEGTGQVAPDFMLKDIHGNTFRFSDLKGKVVLLDFWATWCGPCKVEIPGFIELQDKYGPEGFQVLGVSVDDKLEQLVPYAAEMKMNYPVLQGLGRDDLLDAYGPILGIPTTILISRDGQICATHAGMTSKEAFENGIKALL